MDLTRLVSRIQDTKTDIEIIQNVLNPPGDLGSSIDIDTNHIDEVQQNIQNVLDNFKLLINKSERYDGLLTATCVFYVITRTYHELISKRVENIESQLIDTDVVDTVDKLKKEFRTLRKRAQDSEAVDEYVENNSEFIETVEDIGNLVFDFEDQAGSSKISVDDLDYLLELDQSASSDLDRLKSINSKVDRLTSKRSNIVEEKSDIKSRIGDLAEATSGGNKL